MWIFLVLKKFSHKHKCRTTTIVFWIHCIKYKSNRLTPTSHIIVRSRWTYILDVGESTLDVGEQTVGETTRRRNDRNSFQQQNVAVSTYKVWRKKLTVKVGYMMSLQCQIHKDSFYLILQHWQLLFKRNMIFQQQNADVTMFIVVNEMFIF